MLASVLLAVMLQPQPPFVLGSQRLGFDYSTANLATFGIVRFEQRIDDGAWVSIAMPPAANDELTPAGFTTFSAPIPALVTGPHSVFFRACSADLCGALTEVFTFRLTVEPPAPSGTRILKPTKSGGV